MIPFRQVHCFVLDEPFDSRKMHRKVQIHSMHDTLNLNLNKSTRKTRWDEHISIVFAVFIFFTDLSKKLVTFWVLFLGHSFHETFFLNLVQETSIVLRGWRCYAKSTVHILLHLYTCIQDACTCRRRSMHWYWMALGWHWNGAGLYWTGAGVLLVGCWSIGTVLQ